MDMKEDLNQITRSRKKNANTIEVRPILRVPIEKHMEIMELTRALNDPGNVTKAYQILLDYILENNLTGDIKRWLLEKLKKWLLEQFNEKDQAK